MKVVELEYELHPRQWHKGDANPFLRALLEANRSVYAEHLRYFAQIRDDFTGVRRGRSDTEPTVPYWDNGYLPGFDIVTLHGFLTRYNPSLYLEIGSGNSTMVARRAIAMNKLRTKIVSLDPHPRAQIDRLCDAVIRTPLQDASLETLPELQPGDIVFFDGSHYAYMNSDVTVFFFEILPKIPPGVLVQIHDICLPYDYPADWAHRFYSEQYLLAAALLYGTDSFFVELPNMYVSWDAELGPILREFWNSPTPIDVPDIHGASFWFRKTK